MEHIEWDDKYSVGVRIIDSQHEKLFKLINTAVDNVNARVDSESISEILSELVDYSMVHFSTEEGYMREIGYDGIDFHKKEHKQFKIKVGNLCVETLKKSDFVPEDILEFLSGWLVNHILCSDMKYRQCCQVSQ